MIPSYPKIFSVGTRYIKDIFEEDVVIEEKLDGSQFSAGKINGELHFRSKGTVQYPSNPDHLFKSAISYIISIRDRLPEGKIFYGEILNKPKHNTLKYNSTPENGIMLFGICDVTATRFSVDKAEFEYWADILKIDPPRRVFEGKVDSKDQLLSYLDLESYLGGPTIEGVVVKNYSRPFILGDRPMPFMAGKLVSEKFKEVHQKSWSKENTSKGKWQDFLESYKTVARWEKAIQHLRESGKLENSPRDIGNLIKEIKEDILSEEKEIIKDFLWKEFGGELLRNSVKGFPEFYKEKLVSDNFEEK